jgi:hypothetical protein
MQIYQHVTPVDRSLEDFELTERCRYTSRHVETVGEVTRRRNDVTAVTHTNVALSFGHFSSGRTHRFLLAFIFAVTSLEKKLFLFCIRLFCIF